MTAIRHPPLCPLFPDSGADLFASFQPTGSPPAGTPIPIASLIGYQSTASMQPVMAVTEYYESPQESVPIGLFTSIPAPFNLLSGGIGNGFIYQMDGRKLLPFSLASHAAAFFLQYFGGKTLSFTAQPSGAVPGASLGAGYWVSSTLGLVFVAKAFSGGTNAVAYSFATGAVVWSANLGSVNGSGVVMTGAGLFFSTLNAAVTGGTANLWRVDPLSGSVLQTYLLGSNLTQITNIAARASQGYWRLT